MSILEEILAGKKEEASALRRGVGESALCEQASSADPARGFAAALRRGARPRVIAEFKRASPSRGAIRTDADPAAIAAAYEHAGASALSVLTDADFFQGSLADLRAARSACTLPVLRKDFMVDPIQVLEARAAGADAVLLIVAAVDDARLRELAAAAVESGLDVLVEVHSRPELDRALELDAGVLGINNRDLKTFHTDIAVTRSLLPHTAGRSVVSESGLDSAETLRSLQAEGVDAFLIGEALMRAPEPGEELARLRGTG